MSEATAEASEEDITQKKVKTKEKRPHECSLYEGTFSNEKSNKNEITAISPKAGSYFL